MKNLLNNNAFVAATFCFVLFVYLLPGIVASLRRHHQRTAIWVLTIFTAGTGIGWIAALVWASTRVDHREERERDYRQRGRIAPRFD